MKIAKVQVLKQELIILTVKNQNQEQHLHVRNVVLQISNLALQVMEEKEEDNKYQIIINNFLFFSLIFL